MKNIVPFLLLSLTWCNTQAQDLPVNSVTSNFEEYLKHQIQEKLFLHTDNDFYLTGENVWLKVYSVDGASSKPLSLSSVAYLELLDSNQKPVIQKKIELKNGFGDAAIYLPATMESGVYTLRAYTQWMKNFSPELYFHKFVTVINTFKKLPQRSSGGGKPSPTIRLFPEGGNLLNDVRTKIAFEIRDASGNSINTRGWVTSSTTNDTIVHFNTLELGLGHFYLTPEKDHNYIVKFLDGTGKTITTAFPKAQESGWALTLELANADVNISVQGKNVTDEAIYLFGHARDTVVVAKRQPLVDGKTLFSFPENLLPEGVSHLTIFDSQLRPVSERLYFKPVSRSLPNLALQHREAYKTREKIDLRILSESPDGKSVAGNFSISVYKIDSLATPAPNGLPEFVWLSSELGGRLNHPELFLQNGHREVTDILMLTHAWRRVNWKEPFTTPEISNLPEYSGHQVRGRALTRAGRANPGRLIFFSSPDAPPELSIHRSDKHGEIVFEKKDFYGQRKIVIQSDSLDDFDFSLTDPFSASPGPQEVPAFFLDRKHRKNLIERSIAMQVRSTYNRNNTRAMNAITKDTIPFYGEPDDSYRLDDYTRFPTMEEVLREYVPKVRVRNRRDGFHFVVVDVVNETIFEKDPLVVVDGVPSDANQVLAMNPLSVKRLDVVGRKYILGPASFDGVVSLMTYNSDLATLNLDPKTFVINYEALMPQMKFEATVYSDQNIDSPLPDKRYLLYWQPSATTNKDGVWEDSFFASDIPGDYVIVVEGITTEGNAGRAVSKFKVVKR